MTRKAINRIFEDDLVIPVNEIETGVSLSEGKSYVMRNGEVTSKLKPIRGGFITGESFIDEASGNTFFSNGKFFSIEEACPFDIVRVNHGSK